MEAAVLVGGVRGASLSPKGLSGRTLSAGGWRSIHNGLGGLNGGPCTGRRGGWPIAVLVAAVVLSAIAWGSHRNPHAMQKEAGPGASEAAPREGTAEPAGAPPALAAEPQAPAVKDRERPMLAIVVDDFGWGIAGTEEALSLPPEVTVAVMPGGPHSVEEAERARRDGHEVLLHLPMEPLDAVGRGLTVRPGTITTSMESGEIRRLVESYLEEVGPVSGLNNHTGSRATADLRVVEAVAQVARDRGVFVIDSRTAGNSILEAVARRNGVPAASNEMFLDNKRDESYVRSCVLAAASLAGKKGAAIAIGHVNPVTIKAVREALPDVERMGVSLVAASRVVRALNPPPSGLGDPRLK